MSRVPEDVVDAATHGSYCPKMCTFACPVTAATGRDDAVPWSFHRAVVDIASDAGERVDPSRLVACTGCFACQVPCAWDQDVPGQVRAARAVTPPRSPAADPTLAALAAGRRPDGASAPAPETAVGGRVVVLAGCHDQPDAVQAVHRLLRAAGHDSVVVAAPGCCGQLATDLGARDTAAERGHATAERLAGASQVVVVDPHCLPALREVLPGTAVLDPWTLLDQQRERLSFQGPPITATYHDPCVLARGEGVTGPPRRLLAAAGVTVIEPEGNAAGTVCSGAGMALPLLDEAAADATGQRRAAQLRTPADHVVVACSRSGQQLGRAGLGVDDLAALLAERLAEEETV